MQSRSVHLEEKFVKLRVKGLIFLRQHQTFWVIIFPVCTSQTQDSCDKRQKGASPAVIIILLCALEAKDGWFYTWFLEEWVQWTN